MVKIYSKGFRTIKDLREMGFTAEGYVFLN
jgi:hypothetical protein